MACAVPGTATGTGSARARIAGPCRVCSADGDRLAPADSAGPLTGRASPFHRSLKGTSMHDQHDYFDYERLVREARLQRSIAIGRADAPFRARGRTSPGRRRTQSPWWAWLHVRGPWRRPCQEGLRARCRSEKPKAPSDKVVGAAPACIFGRDHRPCRKALCFSDLHRLRFSDYTGVSESTSLTRT